MRKSFYMILTVILTVCMFTGCSGSDSSGSSYEMNSIALDNAGFTDAMFSYSDSKGTDDNSSVSESAEINEDSSTYSQKLIITYDMTYETKTFDDSVAYVKDQVQKYNGYIENSNMYGYGTRCIDLTIRIPEQHAKAFLEEAGNIGELTRSTESAEDITLEYYDTEARLEMLRTQHERLLELLAEAETLEDIITLEDKIGEVEYQINSYQSTMKLYDNLIDYTTINLTIDEVENISVIEKDNVLTRIVKGFSESLHNVGDFIVDAFVYIVTHIPQILLIGCVIAIASPIHKKLKAKKQEKKEAKKQSTDKTTQ